MTGEDRDQSRAAEERRHLIARIIHMAKGGYHQSHMEPLLAAHEEQLAEQVRQLCVETAAEHYEPLLRNEYQRAEAAEAGKREARQVLDRIHEAFGESQHSDDSELPAMVTTLRETIKAVDARAEGAQRGKREAEERARDWKARALSLEASGRPCDREWADRALERERALTAEVAQLKAEVEQAKEAWCCPKHRATLNAPECYFCAFVEAAGLKTQLSDARAEIERLRGERDRDREVAVALGVTPENMRALRQAHDRVEVLEKLSVELYELVVYPPGTAYPDGRTRETTLRKAEAALQGTEPQPAAPKCAICGKPATCLGRYEIAQTEEYACDDCCQHGNEDGHCRYIEPQPEPKA